MIERKNIKHLDWHPETDFDTYDVTRYFINQYNTFPNNTIFIGSNNKKGYLSYYIFREKLEENNALLLHRSENYNSGVRKIYFDLDGTIFLLESIYRRELKDFKNYPEILDKIGKDIDNAVDILGTITVLHSKELMDEKHRKLIDESFIKPKNIHKIGMIARDNSGFFLNEIRLETNELSHELDLHYGNDFNIFHNKLIKKLSEKNKGLTLLHGKHGTGKSFYIKKLIFDITEKTNKKIILLPASLINYIIEPEFNMFLLEIVESYEYEDDDNFYKEENSKKGNDGLILLLEDAEVVLQKRDQYNSNNQSTSNILNLTDGILNDIFNVQIIATYNTEDSNIDPALKREKRLIAKKEFTNLSIEDSKKLAKYLKIDEKQINKSMSVAEIYSMLDKEDNDILIDKREKKRGKHF